jgi:hypothetical protein
VFTDESQVTEKDLHLAIDEARVDEAVQIYDIMLKKTQRKLILKLNNFNFNWCHL